MLDDSFTLAIIPLSLGISGLIFLGIALFLNYKYSYKGGVKTTGVLVCFRKLDNDHAIGAVRTAMGVGGYKDYDDNVTNSKPVFRFIADGESIECHSEWSVTDLDRKDIGKSFPIRYFPIVGGNYTVVMEGKRYEQQREVGRRIVFWIFAGIGIGLVVIAALSLLIFV